MRARARAFAGTQRARGATTDAECSHFLLDVYERIARTVI